MNKLTGWDDTIVALATPQGIGAIGIIRLSGERSLTIINDLFSSKNLLDQSSHTLHIGFLKDGDQFLDEVVLSLFKTPSSYTGEDIVEISCHGSPYIQKRIVEVCIKKGARLAKPGEFTQRAFLNGKLDLAQAEAVADLIASNTEASHLTALRTIRGGFSHTLKVLRERLIKFSALIELELDFSQEDVEFADRTQLFQLINELMEATRQLIESFRLGNVIRNGVSVAIIGRPNAGKSTLLNTLLNENRAIVSDIPGTTRDTIEEVLNIDGIIFRLIDTAGIRKHTSDSLESAGIQRSVDKMKQSDLVLYVFEIDDSLEDIKNRKNEMDEQGLNYLFVANKIDGHDGETVKNKFSGLGKLEIISAKRGLNIEMLKEKMVEAVVNGKIQTENTIITNVRHYHSLIEVEKALIDIHTGLENKLSGELLALEIRRCLHYLGEITGEITNDDMLDYIFSKFCIGK